MPENRDQRARARDDDANERDLRAAIRDGLVPDEELSEREIASRRAARDDREASARDRLSSAEDRRSAEEVRRSAQRSGE